MVRFRDQTSNTLGNTLVPMSNNGESEYLQLQSGLNTLNVSVNLENSFTQ